MNESGVIKYTFEKILAVLFWTDEADRDNPIRSKMHYYEGIIYRANLPAEFDVLFGHVSRFSGLSRQWFKDIDSTFIVDKGMIGSGTLGSLNAGSDTIWWLGAIM